jgi:predicted  nucleic acid-binding Zn-ribbon protein
VTGESQRDPTTGVPDPTVLTTEQMLRAIENLEKQLTAKIDALEREVNLRETYRLELKGDAEKALTAAMASAERAVNKAEVSAEKRFEGINEFRKTLNDQAALFMPRTEFDTAHDALVEIVNTLSGRRDRSVGSVAGARLTTAGMGAGLAALAAVVIIANILSSLLAR